jgi:hypothetical protein
MLITHSYANLETLVPGIDINPDDINPGGPPPDSFTDTPWPGGTTLNIDGPQWAAGLSKRSVTVLADVLASISRITFSFQIRPSQLAAVLSQAPENDLMITDQAANRYNGSLRKNNQKGGMWQIANAAGAWVDTGFDPGPFLPDVWTPASAVYQMVWGKSISVLSITDGAETFTFPSPVAYAPTPNSKWAPNLLDVQLQEVLENAGSFTRDTRNIGILLQ